MKKMYFSIFLLVIIWLMTLVILNYNILYTSLSVAILSAIYMVYPIIYLNMKERTKEEVKSTLVKNSVVVTILYSMVISFVYSQYDGTVIVYGMIGAIIYGFLYYFINFGFFLDEKKEKVRKITNEFEKINLLKEWKKLLDDHIITKKEFEEKKKEIL